MEKLHPFKHSRYIDILSDFGFKYVFGSEPNKDLLIHFLNEIFKGEKCISDIQYSKTEFHGESGREGVVIFDLLCTGDNGEMFIIEVQRARQDFFIQRSVSYVSRLISEQIPKGGRNEWRYDIKDMYFIAILETFPIDPDDDLYMRTANIRCCENNKVLYNGLKFFFVELCKFAKDVDELNSDLDNWLYVLKNTSRLDMIPLYTKKPVFQKLFQISEYSNLPKEEKDMYDLSIRHKWDYQNTIDYAKKEGMEQKSHEIISNLICKSQMTDIEIAKIVDTEANIVKKIRSQLQIK